MYTEERGAYLLKLTRQGAIQWKHSFHFDTITHQDFLSLSPTADGGSVAVSDVNADSFRLMKLTAGGELACFPFTNTDLARRDFRLIRKRAQVGIKKDLPLQVGPASLPLRTPHLAVSPVCR